MVKKKKHPQTFRFQVPGTRYVSLVAKYRSQILHYSTFKQCFRSGSARIPIHFARLDPDADPYWNMDPDPDPGARNFIKINK